MNTRRMFAALALVGTTLSLTGATAVSPASALSATSPFCKALGQLPINLASFGPTASVATLKAVAKTDGRINATACDSSPTTPQVTAPYQRRRTFSTTPKPAHCMLHGPSGMP